MARISASILLLGVGLAASMAVPAAAQTDDAISARLEALFGEHEPYERFLAILKTAVSAGDKKAVAALFSYPVQATIAGERVVIGSEDELIERYDRLLAPAVVAAIGRQTYAALFANWQGVMIGSGEIWFSGICRSGACSEAEVKITAINVPDG